MIESFRHHSSLQRGVMLDWLHHCDETGEPHPTDAAIADRFCFSGIEAARTLLADLADRGEICISYNGHGREIVVAPAKAHRQIGSERPLARSVKKPKRPRPDVDATVAKIMKIVRRDPTAPRPEPEVQKARPPVIPAKPKEPVMGNRIQLNICPSPELFERIRALAQADGLMPGQKARDMLERAINQPAVIPEPMVELTGKPKVRAEVARAATEARMELHDFCSKLLDLGLEVWVRRRIEGEI